MPDNQKGLMRLDRKAKPPPSAKKFVYPDPRSADEKVRQQFAASLQELLLERKQTHTDLAAQVFGTFATTKTGYNPPRNLARMRDFMRAEKIPGADVAEFIGEALHVPVERLFKPRGEFKMPDIKPRGGPYAVKGKGKGHAKGNGANGVNGEFVLPQGVDRPVATLTTDRKHHGFVKLKVEANLPLKVALAVMGLIEPGE